MIYHGQKNEPLSVTPSLHASHRLAESAYDFVPKGKFYFGNPGRYGAEMRYPSSLTSRPQPEVLFSAAGTSPGDRREPNQKPEMEPARPATPPNTPMATS